MSKTTAKNTGGKYSLTIAAVLRLWRPMCKRTEPYSADEIKRFKIRPFKVGAETHYANFDGAILIAYCHNESSAKAVRDDAIRRARKAERSEG